MSLLLDALKAAENLKRPNHPGGELHSRSTADLSGSETSELLSLADDPVPPAQARPAVAPLALASPVAKQPGSRARKPRRASSVSLLAGLLAVVVSALGMGWWYLSPDDSSVALINAPMPIATTSDTAVAPAPGLIETFSLSPPTGDPPAEQPLASQRRTASSQSRERLVPAPGADSGSSARMIVAPAPLVGTVVVSARPSPVLAAYAAFQAGDLARAEALYNETLLAEPLQPDAHLGLAVIAQARGNPGSAARHYREVINAMPAHSRAWAGLADLASDSELAPMESRLRVLIADHPAAALQFALGNILMRQSRWPEAQEAYFSASAAAPANADYAFNLAVALDHIGKREAAGRFYAQAIDLAAGARTQFDLNAARQRLAILRQDSK